MRNARVAAVGFFMVAWAFVAAQAGTVMVVDVWSYDQYSDSGTHTLYIGDNRVRMEIAGKDTSQVIFDVENKDAPVILILDPATHSYRKFDEKTINKVHDKMLESWELFNTWTAKMTADEKKEFIEKYKKNIRQAEELIKYEDRMKKIAYEKVASGEKVGEWPCDHLKGTLNDELYKEVWIAGYGDLGVEEKDLAVLNALSESFRGFAGEMIPFKDRKAQGSDSPVTGFPVKIVYYEEGNKFARQVLKSIRKEDLDAKLFALPEGYQEKPALPE